MGALLAGIVFLNVSLLQLNQEIARTSTHATALDRENSGLRARVAALDSSERIQRLAEDRGMVMPAPGQYRYLRARPWLDGELASRRIVAPQPPGQALAQGTPPATSTPASAAPATTSTPSSTTPVTQATAAPPPTATPTQSTAASPSSTAPPAAVGTP
jgi:cell division protein FtsL